MFQTNSIMEQEKINDMHNIKELLESVDRESIVSAHGQATD